MHVVARFTALLALTVVASGADRVRLKDGREFDGRVVLETKDRIVLLVGTKEREFLAADVAEVQSIARTQADLVRRWSGLAKDDAARRMELAHEARSKELPGEAEVLAWSALDADAGHEGAHVFLGHEKRDERWMVKDGVKWIRYEDLARVRSDFTDAWRFSTLHFSLRTNLELDDACVALLESELHYQAFFEWFRAELELREVVEQVNLELHAQQKNYPGGSGRGGFYDDDSNTVYARMEQGFVADTLAHENTHALLHSTTERTRKAVGSLPAWLDEGLSDLMRFGRSGPVGRAKYTLPRPGGWYFTMHAGARDPLSLARVLALTVHDFNIGSTVGLAYAQSYTLVQFCLNASEQAHRARFFDYLRSCWSGKSSATDFKSALGIKGSELESAWHAFARTGK